MPLPRVLSSQSPGSKNACTESSGIGGTDAVAARLPLTETGPFLSLRSNSQPAVHERSLTTLTWTSKRLGKEGAGSDNLKAYLSVPTPNSNVVALRPPRQSSRSESRSGLPAFGL